jgi:CheY-like chemotaxis protein
MADGLLGSTITLRKGSAMATILLIDDDVDLVEMNSVVLAHRGHEVLKAYSAAEARRKLEAGAKPDVVVLDVMMEEVSAGFDLAREIHQKFPDLPTIMLSGVQAATGVPFRFKPDETWLPVVRFLDKPVAPAALANEIDQLLAK